MLTQPRPPLQRVLIVHTPPRDGFVRSISPDLESQENPSAMPTPDTFNRRRAISWLGDEGSPGSVRSSPRRLRGSRSNLASRSASRDRDGNTTDSEHP